MRGPHGVRFSFELILESLDRVFFSLGRSAWVFLAACGIVSSLLVPEAIGDVSWVRQIHLYPVGQTDPFHDEIHRHQSLRLLSEEREALRRDFPEWTADSYFLVDAFPGCYESLQLKFDPHEFEERGLFLFDREIIPHQTEDLSISQGNQTYSIHIDRFADPRHEGKYGGAILVVPGTGSYGGNYIKFALAMAVLKGYIVYAIDPIGHGRSHGFKIIRKNSVAGGTGVFLERGISESGQWQIDRALEKGWEEIDPCRFSIDQIIGSVQAVGRRIVKREEENLRHLDDLVLSLSPEKRPPEWFGKPVNSLTHLTLVGSSQGGETAFWAADPRATGQGQNAAYGILYPFDSVVCHDVYNTAYDAPQTKMKLVKSGWSGPLISRWMASKDSLWVNADWTKYYEGTALFLRASDRWVRWRYDMTSYRNLLKFGERFRETLPQMEVPVLVAIGKDDKLYSNDKHAHQLVSTLFEKLNRPHASESLWYLEYETPPGRNGHQLLVHHTFPFADLVDTWIWYRRGGPGSSFSYERGLWKRID